MILVPLCPLLSPAAVEALAEVWCRVGAELGPGATDMGAGREAFSVEGRDAFSVAGGLRVWGVELPGLPSGVSSVFSVLLFTLEKEEEDELL